MTTQGNPLPAVILMGVVAALVGVGVYVSFLRDKKRNAAMKAVAQTMGFAYEEETNRESLEASGFDLPLFKVGHSRNSRRMLRGRLADRDAAIFDYRYTTGSGKSAHTHSQTVVMFTDGAKGLPEFQLSPEGVLHGLAEVFGAQDIDFEQSEEFSKRYLLKGPDEAAIRRAFTIDVLAWFSAAPGWRVQSGGGRLLAFHGEKLVEPSEVPAFAAEALRIVGLFKV